MLSRLSDFAVLGLDCETSGLRPLHDDRLFSVILADDEGEFYFSFLKKDEFFDEVQDALCRFFLAKPREYCFSNAKFDLHFLHKFGATFHPESTFYDTAVGGRLLDSSLPSYGLDALSEKYLGERKGREVMDYIVEHDLHTDVSVRGLAKKVRLLHFDRVPLEILQPYAEKDARLTLKLAKLQTARIAELDATRVAGRPTITAVLENEKKLTKVLLKMERSGVRLDVKYCEEALTHEEKRQADAILAFKEITDRDYKASGKLFEEVFEIGAAHPRTDKGNLQFDAAALEKIDDPVAKYVLTIKDAKARANFFAGFLHQRDSFNYIHTDFKQCGAATGRFSSRDPNLQNMSRNEDIGDEGFPVRRCIVPDNPSYCLVMLDYDQQEFRMMLDYAGEMGLIESVKGGADVHQATADLVEIPRQRAKTLNFALIYGAGPQRIADMLSISLEEAQELLAQYFGALPRVKALLGEIRGKAKARKYIFNWFGRRITYPRGEGAYAASNHLIQGGAADVIKVAMNRVHDFLLHSNTSMRLVIHDELVLVAHHKDLHLIEGVKKIMEEAYPATYLPLTVSVSHSWTSLADKTKGFPVSPF